MNKLIKFLPLVAAGAAVVSCTDYDLGITSEEIKYRKNFVETFGQIDPQQDWNFATRGSVTVTTGEACPIRIYAKKGEGYKIVGDYANVNGTQTLGFDIQEGITDILVTNGQASVFTKVGESVSLVGTRTAHSTGTTVVVADVYKDFDFSYVSAVTDLLTEDADNRGKVTENFSYVSTGPFTIYPIYWNTSSVHTMGVYYKNASGNYETIPFYDTRVGDELALKEVTAGTKCEDAFTHHVGDVCKSGHVISRIDGSDFYYPSEVSCCEKFPQWKPGLKCKGGVEIASIDYTQYSEKIYHAAASPVEERCIYAYQKTGSEVVGGTCIHGHTISKFDAEGHVYHMNPYEVCSHGGFEFNVGDVCSAGHTISRFDRHDWGDDLYYMGDIKCTCGFEVHVGDVCTASHIIDFVDHTGNYYNSPATYNYKTTFAGNAAFSAGKTVGSKGITINLPVGTQFGFYLDVYDGETYNETDDKMTFTSQGTFYHTVYSQAEVNQEFAGKTTMTGKTPNAGTGWKGQNVKGTYVFGSTFNRTVNGQDTKYVCFEDWNLAGPDLQDLVFVIDGDTPPVVVDEDADKWVICAEDLGNTFDLDYNDVVVAVSHVSGKEKATVAPLAAGGTLASYVYFGGTCLGEIHEILGASNTNSGSYSPINVNGSISVSAVEIEVPVSTTWSLASSSIYDASYTGDATMGGFNVKVVPAGEASTADNATKSGQIIQSSFSNGTQDIPYVICVPQQWERSDAKGWFRWSNETTPISPLTGYSASGYHTEGHTFSDWVSDHTKNDWFMYPDESNTTGLQGVTAK